MKKPLLFILLCLPFSLLGNALDSLVTSFHDANGAHDKSIIAFSIGKDLAFQGKKDSSKYFFRYTLFQENGLVPTSIQAQSAFWLGYLAREEQNYSSAITHFTIAYQFFQTLGDKNMTARAAWDLGESFTQIGNLKEAKVYFDQAESIFLSIGFPQNKHNFYHDRGLSFWLKGDMLEATHYLRKAIESNPDDLIKKSQILNLLGNCYKDQNKPLEAQEAYQEAIYLALETKSTLEYGWPLNQMGRLNEKKGHVDSAIFYFTKVIDLLHDFSFPVLEATAKLNLARMLSLQSHTHEALALIAEVIVLAEGQENTSNLIASLELGVRLANQVGDNTLHNQYLDLLLSHTTSTYEHNRKTQQLADNAEVEKNLLQRELEGYKLRCRKYHYLRKAFWQGC